MNYKKDSANDASKSKGNETQYNLDSEISVWSDFLRTHWHPKSLCIVSQYMHNATFAPFDTFSYGLDIYEKVFWCNRLRITYDFKVILIYNPMRE